MTAVCLGGPPTADLGRRRFFEPEGVLIQSELEPCGMPAMHCACILTAVHRVLVQSSPSRPRSSHRARPTALVLPPSSSALTPPRSSHYGDRCKRIDRVRICICICCASATASACLARSHNLSSFLNSNYRSLYRFHPIWSAGGSGLRSVIVMFDAMNIRRQLLFLFGEATGVQRGRTGSGGLAVLYVSLLQGS